MRTDLRGDGSHTILAGLDPCHGVKAGRQYGQRLCRAAGQNGVSKFSDVRTETVPFHQGGCAAVKRGSGAGGAAGDIGQHGSGVDARELVGIANEQ